MADAVVVGAGESGLRSAQALAERGHRVILVERLPAAGGQHPDPAVGGPLERAALAAEVSPLYGTLAVAWDGARLATLGVDGARTLQAQALVVATGSRALTRGEAGIAGDRCAGVVPASAAMHLSESGVLLGHRPVVTGGTPLACTLAALLRHAGAEEVTIVSPENETVAPVDVRLIGGWRVVSAHGRLRVARVTIERAGEQDSIPCDALVLADGSVPMHNIEGAGPTAAGVIFCRISGDAKTSSAEASARAVAGALALLEPVSTPSQGAFDGGPLPGRHVPASYHRRAR